MAGYPGFHVKRGLRERELGRRAAPFLHSARPVRPKPLTGSPVRDIRLAARLTQAELARRLSVTRSRVLRLERQGAQVRWDTVLRVAEACGVTLDLQIVVRSTHSVAVEVTKNVNMTIHG